MLHIKLSSIVMLCFFNFQHVFSQSIQVGFSSGANFLFSNKEYQTKGNIGWQSHLNGKILYNKMESVNYSIGIISSNTILKNSIVQHSYTETNFQHKIFLSKDYCFSNKTVTISSGIYQNKILSNKLIGYVPDIFNISLDSNNNEVATLVPYQLTNYKLYKSYFGWLISASIVLSSQKDKKIIPYLELIYSNSFNKLIKPIGIMREPMFLLSIGLFHSYIKP